MTADMPDPVKVAREACAERAEEEAFPHYAERVRAGEEDTCPEVSGAILGARAMQDAMAGREGRVKALSEFARKRIREAWDGCEGGDEIQEHAQKLGLIVEEPGGYDPEKHGNSCEAEPGDQWFVFADWLDDNPKPTGAQEGATADTRLNAVTGGLDYPAALATKQPADSRSDPALGTAREAPDMAGDKVGVSTLVTPAPDVPGLVERLDHALAHLKWLNEQVVKTGDRATAAEAERDALRGEVERKDKALREIGEWKATTDSWYRLARRFIEIARAALSPAKGG